MSGVLNHEIFSTDYNLTFRAKRENSNYNITYKKVFRNHLNVPKKIKKIEIIARKWWYSFLPLPKHNSSLMIFTNQFVDGQIVVLNPLHFESCFSGVEFINRIKYEIIKQSSLSTQDFVMEIDHAGIFNCQIIKHDVKIEFDNFLCACLGLYPNTVLTIDSDTTFFEHKIHTHPNEFFTFGINFAKPNSESGWTILSYQDLSNISYGSQFKFTDNCNLDTISNSISNFEFYIFDVNEEHQLCGNISPDFTMYADEISVQLFFSD
jgi:hypothetical protein